MADFSLKQNDTWPPLEATLTDQDGPIDLSAALGVRLLLKGQRRTSPAIVAGLCTILDPKTDGNVVYNWVPADTAVADLFNAEFEITWSDGSVQSVPNDRYFFVDIKPDLG